MSDIIFVIAHAHALASLQHTCHDQAAAVIDSNRSAHCLCKCSHGLTRSTFLYSGSDDETVGCSCPRFLFCT